MKKFCILFVALFLLRIGNINAQYTILHNFYDTGFTVGNAGSGEPWGSLIRSGNLLYGMTNQGGANLVGSIFSIDTNGLRYRDLWDFDNRDTNGESPQGSLTISGGKLYGMTLSGGTYNYGCVFSIDTNGGGFKILLNFNGANGQWPHGSLTIFGKKLYGMTEGGGANNLGVIFSVDTDGREYKNLLDCGYPSTYPLTPQGSLIFVGSKLFGMSSGGGMLGDGNIFSIDTDGSNYRDIYEFTDHAFPNGSLTYSGSKFYGMTAGGGPLDFGNIFSVDTTGKDYADLYDFNDTNGRAPWGDVTIYSNALVGMALAGGALEYGCIFSIDTNGSGFNVFQYFNGPNGETPLGNLTLSGSNLYGMTQKGGINDDGVIFSFKDVDLGINNLSATLGSINLYPNPSNGQFTLSCRAEAASVSQLSVEVYNVLGEQVYTTTLASFNSQIDLSSQPNGVYLCRVISHDGGLIGEAKLVIQK